ncbi:hypothetical protein PAXINDRAFT_5573 [Paxillus involutus ATCC 200175]|nr:hypothetical protein PAXINDRAFT_5573 [Paxillus involutus ATCC 200175]
MGGMDFSQMMSQAGASFGAGSGGADEEAAEEDSDDDGPPPLEDAEPAPEQK